MKVWHFWDVTSGLFTGRTFSASNETCIAASCWPGEGARCDVVDWQSQRVDVETGELVDYQPPAPDEHHEWVGRRWVLRADVAAKRARELAILTELRSLDERLIRPMGELALDPNNEDARSAALRITAEKTSLRSELQELRK